MAPEIISEVGHGYASDWWALGIVLYELATGNPPFNSHDVFEIANRIKYEEIVIPRFFSEDLHDLIERLTHKQAKARLGMRGGSAEIKMHSFFRNVDWEKVRTKRMKPPVHPLA